MADRREVRIGMLGSGFIGEFHADGLRYVPDARVVANYGAGPDRRASFAERFGSRPMASIDELTLKSRLREIGAGEGATRIASGEAADA